MIRCSNEFRQTILFGNNSENDLVKITKSEKNLGGRIVLFFVLLGIGNMKQIVLIYVI